MNAGRSRRSTVAEGSGPENGRWVELGPRPCRGNPLTPLIRAIVPGHNHASVQVGGNSRHGRVCRPLVVHSRIRLRPFDARDVGSDCFEAILGWGLWRSILKSGFLASPLTLGRPANDVESAKPSHDQVPTRPRLVHHSSLIDAGEGCPP